MAENKSIKSPFATELIPRNNQISKIKQNREYLINNYIAGELNTYLNSGIFKTFNDVYAAEYDNNGNQILDKDGPGTPGVRSIFNKSGAVLIGTSTGNIPSPDAFLTDASEFRISNNVPLIDSPNVRKRIKSQSGCSVKELVEASEAGALGRAIYSYSDFMYCKHLGKMSNNYMITLRRFPIPVMDYIGTLGENGTRIEDAGKNMGPNQIGCMVTWLGVSGNDMSNILKYSYTMPYKEASSQWNPVDGGDADSAGGLLNGIAAAFDPAYRRQYVSGYGGSTLVDSFMGKFFNMGKGPYSAAQEAGFVDANKTYGPIDRVKKTYMRDDQEGINFKQSFSITFEYELRSYNGINGRQAMLDLISNILNVTYTTGGFWGGGYRGGGMHQNSIFANMNIFKVKGGFTDFMDAFAQDYSNVTKTFSDQLNLKFGGNWWSMLKASLNALGGMILGGALNKLGRPAKAYANSLLSEQPVGFWHITIGNPHHPIMSLGNMILRNTTVEHTGPLGLDDFPTGIKVTCEFDRGKPRDLREIEKIYMHGNDRIYHGMGPKILDMYNKAVEYKKSSGNNSTNPKTQGTYNAQNEEIMTGQAEVVKSSPSMPAYIKQIADYTEDELKNTASYVKKLWGDRDVYNVLVSSMEQEYGAWKKKEAPKSETGGEKQQNLA